jgi:hypothetical protein
VLILTSIQKLVNDLIQQQPFIEEALSQGLINHNELGRKLKSQVELNLKKTVNESAVSMAVRRYAKQITEEVQIKNKIELDDADIITRQGLFEFTVHKTPDTLKIVRRIHDSIELSARDFLTITHGMYEITIVTNQRFKSDLEKMFKDDMIKKVIEHLSALSIKLPEDASEGVGLYYIISKALAWNNINIVEIISTWSELTLIIGDDKINLSHEVIQGLVEEKVI